MDEKRQNSREGLPLRLCTWPLIKDDETNAQARVAADLGRDKSVMATARIIDSDTWMDETKHVVARDA